MSHLLSIKKAYDQQLYFGLVEICWASTYFESFTKMGIYYGEQSGKGFKTNLEVSEEELEKYLETWDRDEELLGFSFF